MLNLLEIQLEYKGNWHIGAAVNGLFVKYFSNEHIILTLDKLPSSIDLMFLGKDYNNDPLALCTITNIYYNHLLLNNLKGTFSTENKDYPIIEKCDIININGLYKIFINESVINNQLEKILNG